MSIEAKHAYRFTYLKSEQWQNVRIEALAREEGKCQICFEESIHNDAHHIWYPESIWDTTANHLVILCRPCHDFIHAMMPECKTKDEGDGKSNWIKFRNAILVWRGCKQGLFTSDEGIPKEPKQLRQEYSRLKRLLKEGQITPDIKVLLLKDRKKASHTLRRIINLSQSYLDEIDPEKENPTAEKG